MRGISTAFFKGDTAELSAEAIRREVASFAGLLGTIGTGTVRVWCSYNPDLPYDSPLQSPDRVVPADAIVPFFDDAVRNGVWNYGDVWNRACIEALDGSFAFFLGNDKDLRLGTSNAQLLEDVHSAWDKAGYNVIQWERDQVA